MLWACYCQEIYNCPYSEIMAIFIFIFIVLSDLELSVCEICIGRQTVYTTLSSICSKTTAPICILSKLNCRGCGCIYVDFDVFGLFCLSGTVMWCSKTHLPKSKSWERRLYLKKTVELEIANYTLPSVLKNLNSIMIHFQLYISHYLLFCLVSKNTSCLIKCHFLLKSGFEFPAFERTPRSYFPTLPGDSIFVHQLSTGGVSDSTLKRKFATGEHK